MRLFMPSLSICVFLLTSACSENSKKSSSDNKETADSTKVAQAASNQTAAAPNPHNLELETTLDCTGKSGESKWEALNQVSGTAEYQNKESTLNSFQIANGITDITKPQENTIPLGVVPLKCDQGDIKINLKLYAESNSSEGFQPTASTTIDCEKIRKKINENLFKLRNIF